MVYGILTQPRFQRNMMISKMSRSRELSELGGCPEFSGTFAGREKMLRLMVSEVEDAVEEVGYRPYSFGREAIGLERNSDRCATGQLLDQRGHEVVENGFLIGRMAFRSEWDFRWCVV